MTFRARLQQAILGIVAGTMVAVLIVAQTQNSRSYRSMVDAMFRQQMDTFRREQDAQLALAKKQAARLAESVRIFAALEAGDPKTYNVAADELRLAEFDFFRLASVEAGILAPPERSRAGRFSDAAEAALNAQLLAASQAIPLEQTIPEVGFVILPDAAGVPALYRVLAMRIRNFDQTVGTLFFGQAVNRLTAAEQDPKGPRMLSVFWTQGQLLGDGLPPAWREPLAGQARLIPASSSLSEVALTLNGVPHRADLHLLNARSHFAPAWLVSLFSLEELHKQQRALLLRVILIGLVALGLASVIGLLFAGQLAKPIRDLVNATREVRGGNLAIHLQRGITDEFAVLTESFNEMTAGLALKDRYHSVLSMVTDAKVAGQLMAGTIPLGGELREVTVIFCDIRGYTALSAGRDPREVIALLNQHMGALTEVVYRHHGVISQFAGDAIMIIFGAPIDHPQHAAEAVLCAQEMLAERERLNRETHEPLGIGFGIATGEVVAGCLGTENRADYTVIGERVNLAARLCSVAGAGEIVVDQATRSMLGDATLTEATAPLRLKGFAEPVIAHRVLKLSL